MNFKIGKNDDESNKKLEEENEVAWSSWGPGMDDWGYLASRTCMGFMEYLASLSLIKLFELGNIFFNCTT